ncbi:Phosphatidic acid phosphatase type 2/haloperoxidase domain-containing protein [Bordetella sputigena]|uniref:phosphatase PAP2 family protein n=1 Tax=Bordetella sputigena TaxID=1416810 RepID=UPI0039F09FA0
MAKNTALRDDAPSSHSAPRDRTAVRNRWIAGWVLALLLIGLLLLFVDLPLTRYLQANVSPSVDTAFEWIGEIGDSDNYAWIVLAIYIAALVALLRGWDGAWIGGYERVVRGSLLLMAAWVVGGIVTGVLKQTVARARPKVFFEQGFYGLGDAFQGKPFNSFPSSHSLTAFVLAAAISAVAPRWRVPVYTIAVLAGISRLVNLDHFASDVAASALIAITAVHVLKPWFVDPAYRWPLRAPWRWFRRSDQP